MCSARGNRSDRRLLIAERNPDVGVGLRLAFHELIASLRPEQDALVLMPAGGAAPVVSMRWQWRQSITRPIRAFQLNYVPVVMVYFAYDALGLIDVTGDLWIKESLSFTPSQLAGVGVWLTLPWTVKMVFGELVDTVPMFGSQRKSYILVGALLMATGLLILAGAAGRWLTFARPRSRETARDGLDAGFTETRVFLCGNVDFESTVLRGMILISVQTGPTPSRC